MKVYRNIKEIDNRERRGRRLSMAGLVILFIGLIASFVPTWFPPGTTPGSAWGQFMQQYWAIISFSALPLGFLCASLGSYYITRYARRRWPGTNIVGRPDEIVERSLKGLNDYYALFVYSLPVGYVLQTPYGLITLAVRSDKGRVSVAGDKWREGWNFGRIFTLFAREGVGHPPSELADQERKMRDYLAKGPQVADGVALNQVPIEGAVLFLNPQTQLTLDNPTATVLRADQLKDFVRRRGRETKPAAGVVKAAADYLQSNNAATVTELA